MESEEPKIAYEDEEELWEAAQANIKKGKDMITKLVKKLFLLFAELALLTNDHVREFCYAGSRHGDKSSRRRTLFLEKEGWLTSYKRKTGVGRSQKIFTINKYRKGEVADIIGRQDIRIIDLDKNKRFPIEHQLGVNTVLASFNSCCEKNKQYTYSYITDLEGCSEDKDVRKAISEKEYLKYYGGVSLVPDSVICLSNISDRKSVVKSLMILELDRDNTTMKRIGGRVKNVETKIGLYRAYWESQSFKKYDEVFSYAFFGFRLLWVTLTQKRLMKVAELCRSAKVGAWLTTLEEIESHGVFGKIWTVLTKDGAGDKKSLIKKERQQ